MITHLSVQNRARLKHPLSGLVKELINLKGLIHAVISYSKREPKLEYGFNVNLLKALKLPL